MSVTRRKSKSVESFSITLRTLYAQMLGLSIVWASLRRLAREVNDQRGME